MKILIFAPNGGASLSTGGGTNFVLKQASVLIDLGHEVILAGFHTLPLSELVEIHGIPLPNPPRICSNGATHYYNAFRHMPLKFSPYDALLHPGFPRWVRSVFHTVQPDAVWFHDDIPSAALDFVGQTRFYLYVHYPSAGRTIQICPQLARSLPESWNDWIIQTLGSLIICDSPADICEEVWANSSVTARAIRKAWGLDAMYVPTYVQARPNAHRNPLCEPMTIVAIGTFNMGKNYTDLIHGFACSRHIGWRLKVLGHSRDGSYLTRLRRLIRRLGVTNSVDLIIDPKREEIQTITANASVVVQPAKFEPFGLALLESMTCGLAGVAFRGEYTGGWCDILSRGRFGLGFETYQELGALFDLLDGDRATLQDLQTKGINRASDFSRSNLSAACERIHGRE